MSNELLEASGKIAEPINTLFSLIRDVSGIWVEPATIRRKADADAYAIGKIEDAKTQAEVRRIQAMESLVYEREIYQKNLSEIVNKASGQLSDDANPKAVHKDWLAKLVEKAKVVSEEEMQWTFSRILAGEINEPGSFSVRTLVFLETMDKNDAKMLKELASFGWIQGKTRPFVIDYKDQIYVKNGVTFGSLTHLDSIGLIKFDPTAGIIIPNARKRFQEDGGGVVEHNGKYWSLSFREGVDEWFMGSVQATQTGKEMLSIVDAKEVEGLEEYLIDKWAERGTFFKLINKRAATTNTVNSRSTNAE